MPSFRDEPSRIQALPREFAILLVPAVLRRGNSGARSRRGPRLLILAGFLLRIALAAMLSLLLPLAAFHATRRRGHRRPVRMLLLTLAAVSSCIVCSLGYLLSLPVGRPTQHSMFAGLDTVLTWGIFGLLHAVVLAVLLFRDRRPPTAQGPRRRPPHARRGNP